MKLFLGIWQLYPALYIQITGTYLEKVGLKYTLYFLLLIAYRDSDPAPHRRQNSGAVEAQNGAAEGLCAGGRRFESV
jgi:hypothetical protein